MDWKKNEDGDGDKVLKALAVALNAEAGVDELFKRIAAIEIQLAANKGKSTKIVEKE